MKNLLIVDDHSVVRNGIKSLFIGSDHYKVIAEASNCEEAEELAREKHPDIAIVDLKLPDGNGAELIEKIRKACPDCGCILLSAEPHYFGMRLALEAGASAVLSKDISHEEYFLVLDALEKGEISINKNLAPILEEGDGYGLTKREIEIIQKFANGLSYKEIAAQLNLSVRTIESHKVKILKKLGLKTVVEMVRLAEKLGIMEI